MTSTRPPNQPPSTVTPAALEPRKVGSTSEIGPSAQEVQAPLTPAENELFERAVKELWPSLYSQAHRRLQSKADAENLAQDVCFSAWKVRAVRQCAGELWRVIAYLKTAMSNSLASQY